MHFISLQKMLALHLAYRVYIAFSLKSNLNAQFLLPLILLQDILSQDDTEESNN